MPPHYFSYLIPLHPLPHYLSLSSSSSSYLLLSLSILLTTSHPLFLSRREVVRRMDRNEGEK
jgi:hypothetical protein